MPIEQRAIDECNVGIYYPIAKPVTEATFSVYPSDEQGNQISSVYGTAFAVSSDGLFLTADHVVEDVTDESEIISLNRDLTPLSDEVTFISDLEIVNRFESEDIAVLSGDVSEIEPFEYLKVRTGGELDLMGFPVATFGYPINKIEDGVRRLSQKTLSGFISETRDDDGVLKLVVDALFHPGLSGGPLISLMSGDVIGVIHKRQKYEEYDGFGERLFPAHFSEASVTTSSPKYTDIGAELEDLDISFCHRSY